MPVVELRDLRTTGAGRSVVGAATLACVHAKAKPR